MQKSLFSNRQTIFFSIWGLGFFYASTALLLLQAYTLIPSGIATTIHFLYPVVVALIMILFFKESKSSYLFIAMILSMLGVSALTWNNEGVQNFGGIIVAMCSILTYALYIVGVHKGPTEKMDEKVLTFYILLASTLFFVLYVFGTEGQIEPIKNWKSALSIIMLALFPTVISDLTLILAIKNIGSTITSILGSLEPLTAVCIGIWVFQEPFGVKTGIGLCLILLAVLTVIWRSQQSEK